MRLFKWAVARVSLLAILGMTSLLAQSHSVTLSWSWAQGTGDMATGFHVQRANATGGPYTTIATVSSPTTLGYVDTTVTAGATLYYVVTAFNSAGDSAPSSEVRCVIPFSSPATPTGLSGAVK